MADELVLFYIDARTGKENWRACANLSIAKEAIRDLRNHGLYGPVYKRTTAPGMYETPFFFHQPNALENYNLAREFIRTHLIYVGDPCVVWWEDTNKAEVVFTSQLPDCERPYEIIWCPEWFAEDMRRIEHDKLLYLFDEWLVKNGLKDGQGGEEGRQ